MRCPYGTCLKKGMSALDAIYARQSVDKADNLSI